jgi:hypothetical protein
MEFTEVVANALTKSCLGQEETMIHVCIANCFVLHHEK